LKHRLPSAIARIAIVLLAWLAPLAASAQIIGLTFDDGLDPSRERRAAGWNARILRTLEKQHLHAMVFPSLGHIGSAGMPLIERWAAAGHGVGNHTATHRSLASADVSLQDFIADVQRADEALRVLPTFVPMLRFPYLKEGDTLDKRDGMRAWMSEHGYRSAPVSIDTSDWYYNQRYLALQAAGRKEAVRRLQRAYVRHLLARAVYYDTLARQVLGRSPAHVLLLHVNAINAAALPAVIEGFRAKGWHFVAARTAFEDPLYRMQPDTLPAGESIIWAVAKQRGVEGLRYPAEDASYERPLLRGQGIPP
jgi:peptidoglycan/xylan/chitin deacetylase (PgdA/CDA1 family)